MAENFGAHQVIEIPATIRPLGDYSWHGFKKGDRRPGAMTPAELITDLARLPEDVGCVDLSANLLGVAEEGLLKRILELLKTKPHVVEIDLSFNLFSKMMPHQLALDCSEMPASIKTVKMNNNGLGHLPFDGFQLIMRSLCTNGRTVNVENNALDKFPAEALNRFLGTLDASIQNNGMPLDEVEGSSSAFQP